MKSSKPIDDKYLDKIISAAYGNAGIFDRIKIYFDARKNQEIRKLFDEYKETADAVKSFSKAECPVEILETGKNKIRKNITVQKPAAALSIFKHPAAAFATAAIIMGITALLLFNKPKEEKTYSKADVVQAEQQVKQSLALVGKIFKKTQFKLTEDVFGRQVSPPIRKSFEIVNDLFKGG